MSHAIQQMDLTIKQNNEKKLCKVLYVLKSLNSENGEVAVKHGQIVG